LDLPWIYEDLRTHNLTNLALGQENNYHPFIGAQPLQKSKIHLKPLDSGLLVKVDSVGENFNERVVFHSLSHYPCTWAQGRTNSLLYLSAIVEKKP
jgi:hypothetical protein